ncbi:MAG: DUF5610 domain-containing protein [Planctomycetota bacterium]
MNLPSLSGLSSTLGGLGLLGTSAAKGKSANPLDLVAQFLDKNSKSEKDSDSSGTDLASALGGLNLGFLQGQANAVQALSLNVESSRTDFSISGNGFAARGYQESFALDAQFQMGDQLVQLNLQISRSVIGVAVGNGIGGQTGQADGGGFSFDDLLSKLPDDAKALIAQFQQGQLPQDYFSPENTAKRITDFALSGFGKYGGTTAGDNSQEARQKYADYILPAIDKGFADARKLLGLLPDSISQQIDDTRSLIGDRFDQFVKGLDQSV